MTLILLPQSCDRYALLLILTHHLINLYFIYVSDYTFLSKLVVVKKYEFLNYFLM